MARWNKPVFPTCPVILFIFILSTTIIGQEMDQVKEEIFGNIRDALQKAESEDVPILAPDNFRKAAQYYRRGIIDYERGERLDRIQKHVENAQKYLGDALETAKISRIVLERVIDIQKEIERYAVRKAAPYEFGRADRHYKVAVRNIENGDIKSAKKIAQETEKLYRKASIKAVKIGIFQKLNLQIQEWTGFMNQDSIDKAKLQMEQLEQFIMEINPDEFIIAEFFDDVQTQIKRTRHILTSQFPDLIITDFWNEKGSIYYQIMNTGNSIVHTRYQITLSVNDTLKRSEVLNKVLKPQERWKGCFRFQWKGERLVDQIQLTVDPDNKISEKDENNNIRIEHWKRDTKPPLIIAGPEVTEIAQNTVKITWRTDEACQSIIKYGKKAGFFNLEEKEEQFKEQHSLTLTRLFPATTYHFIVQATDQCENIAESRDLTFQTLPLKDDVDPTVSLKDIGTATGMIKIAADAYDNSQLEKVDFFLDQKLLFSDYTPPFTFHFNTEKVVNDRYLLTAKAYDLANNSNYDEYKIDIKNLKDVHAPTALITSPAQNGTKVSGKVKIDVSLSDDKGLAYVYFKVNGLSEEFRSLTNHPKKETVTFEWDTTPLPKGTYTLSVDVFDTDTPVMKSDSDSRTVIVEKKPLPQPPKLKVKHTMTRYGNYFSVSLSVSNVGDQTATKIEISDFLKGFQPISIIRNKPTSARYTAKYDAYKKEWECAIISYENIAPKKSLTYTYFVVPVLIDQNPPKPAIGTSTGLHYDKDAQGLRIHDWCAVPVAKTWGEGLSIPNAHAKAVKEADYLIVTNPAKVSAFGYKQIYTIYDLWSSMAELARQRNGILGFVYDYSTTGLHKLIQYSGKWSSQLKTDWDSFGYLLLVGENEIIPAWSRQFGKVYTTRGNIMLQTDDADYPYANTWGNEYLPELCVGRIIGDSPAMLKKPIEYSYLVAQGDVCCNFDRSKSLIVSGFEEGIGGGSDKINFKSEANAVASQIKKKPYSKSQTLLHTPNYTKYDNSKKIDISATTSSIHKQFFTDAGMKDIVFFAAHGNGGSVDVFTASDINNYPLNFFKTTYPFVFASSCATGEYSAGSGIAEAFFNKGAAVYLGASEHGLEPHSSISPKLYANWDTDESVGYVVRETQRGLSSSIIDRYWTGIYHLYGDPKYAQGKSEQPLASFLNQFLKAFTSALVEIEDYETKEINGKDYISIPGGDLLSVPGKPLVPYYRAFYHFPENVHIQNVTLLEKSNLVRATDLHIPKCIIGIPQKSSSENNHFEQPDKWPLKEFEWTTIETPTYTTLAITIYPFSYNVLTTDATYYKKYQFDIESKVTNIEITKLETDKPVYNLGDSVNVTVEFNDGLHGERPPTGRDIVTHITINADSSEKLLSSLPLRTLKDFKGSASLCSKWSSLNFPSGNYRIKCELKNHEGELLDKQIRYFALGTTSGEITDLNVDPELFRPGQDIKLFLGFQNTGEVAIDGLMIIRIFNEAGEIVNEFSKEIGNLQPIDMVTFQQVWESTEMDDGSYGIMGYVTYNGMATDPELVTISTQ